MVHTGRNKTLISRQVKNKIMLIVYHAMLYMTIKNIEVNITGVNYSHYKKPVLQTIHPPGCVVWLFCLSQQHQAGQLSQQCPFSFLWIHCVQSPHNRS